MNLSKLTPVNDRKAMKIDFIKTFRTATKRELFNMVVSLLMQKYKFKLRMEVYPAIYKWSKEMKKGIAAREKMHDLKGVIKKYPLTPDQSLNKPEN